MNEHPYEQILPFALGDMDSTAASSVLTHADSCPTCAVLLAEAMAGVSAVSSVDDERSPRTVMAPVRRPRRPAALPYWAAALAAAAAVVLAIWNADLRNAPTLVPIAALVHTHFQHHQLRGVSGSAKVLHALDGSWVYVVADDLRPRSKYALWENRAGSITEIGSFQTDGSGRAARWWPQAAGPISGFALSEAGADPRADPRALRWP